jgi:hypothetical protein
MYELELELNYIEIETSAISKQLRIDAFIICECSRKSLKPGWAECPFAQCNVLLFLRN